MFDSQRFGEDVAASAPGALDAAAVAGPPAGPFASGRAYPLAVDVDGDLGAVSYAALDPYPDIEPGWWCVAVAFKRGATGWAEAGDDDNCTTPRPFARPAAALNSTQSWIDWHSNGGLSGTGEPERYHHVFFGVAPTTTARLTVTDRTGRTRPLAVTPWSGAYVAAVDGGFSRLTGYDLHGRELGSTICNDGPSPERDDDPAPAGYERIHFDAGAGGEPIVFRTTRPPCED